MAQFDISLGTDRKDMRILEILAQNCRVSHATLGRALRVSKDTVNYRIERLEREGYLSQYVLFVDARVLGFTRYHLLIRFDTNLANRNDVLRRIAEHPFVMWINTFIGRYDVQVIVDARDGFALNKIREELFDICSHRVKEYSILTHLSDLEFTQLNPVLDIGTSFERNDDASFSKQLTTRKFPVEPEFERYAPTRLDAEILKLLADDPRISLVDIGRTLHCDRQTVKKRISQLIEKKVILNFGGIPNLPRLGFVTYYLLVRLSQDTSIKLLKRPFQQLRNIFYAGRMLGDYDLILYLNARTPDELNESISLLRKEIGNHIIHHDLLIQDKVHYWRQFTSGIFGAITAHV